MVILLSTSAFMLSPGISYGTDMTAFSCFMEGESLNKELQRKVEKAQRNVILIISYDDAGEESRRGSGNILCTDVVFSAREIYDR